MSEPREKSDLVQGTLDMLVLKTLAGGPLHGYAIANRIQQASNDFLTVEEGSLYPACTAWSGAVGSRPNGAFPRRNARPSIIGSRRRGAQLKVAAKNWNRVVEAIAAVMGNRTAET